MAPPTADRSPTTRLRIDFHSHRLPTPAVYTASPRQTTPPLPSHPQPMPSSPPTPSSGPSSAKASWSSILSAASYRNLLGGGGSGSSASGTKRSKGIGSSDPRTSTADEIALANGSITLEVAAAIMEIRRRRTANAEYAKTTIDSLTPTATHPKARSDSMHSQTQPIKISPGPALSSFRRPLPSLSQPVVPKVSLKPVKIRSTFHDLPTKEIV